MKAPAPTTSYDTVQVTVGMTSIPVAVFTTTTEGERTSASFSPDGNPVGLKHYDKVTGELLERDQIVSMTMTDAGPVWIDKEEITEALGLPAKSISIKAFYPLDRLSEFKVKAYRSLEPAPAKTKKGNRDRLHTQQQLSALLAGMAKRGVLGYGEFVTRGRVYPVALLPDGQMLELHYEQNVREARESKLVEPPSDMLAETEALIDRLTEATQPDLNDRRREAFAAYAKTKAEANPVPAPTGPVLSGDALMDALRASIERYRAA